MHVGNLARMVMLHTSMDSSLGDDCKLVYIVDSTSSIDLQLHWDSLLNMRDGKVARIVMMHTLIDSFLIGDCNGVKIISMGWIVHGI